MEKDFVDHSPQELNSILIEKTGITLFPFADVLGALLYEQQKSGGEIPRLKKAGEIDRATLQDQKKRIKNLINKIIEVLADYRFSIEGKPDLRNALKKNKEDAVKLIEELYSLSGLFDLLTNKLLNRIESDLTFKQILRGRGASIKPINLLISMWALLIQCGGRYYPITGFPESPFLAALDWELLANIFCWFWKKLAPYEFYKSLQPSKDVFPEDLKSQFYKHKKRWISYFEYFYSVSFNKVGFIIYFGKNGVDYSHRDLHALKKVTGYSLNEKEVDFLERFFKPYVFGNLSHLIIFPDFSYLAI